MFNLDSPNRIIFGDGSQTIASTWQNNDDDVSVIRLRIAFKWMVRAFSGYLSTDQLLLLWDRILGYDSLEIVAGQHTEYYNILSDTSFLIWSFFYLFFPIYHSPHLFFPLLCHSSISLLLLLLSSFLTLTSSSPSSCRVCLPSREPDGSDITGFGRGTVRFTLDLCVCVHDTLLPTYP